MSEAKSFSYRRVFMPLSLAFVLFLLVAPAVLASPRLHVSLVGPKQRYLALGDSLAFSYQPDLNYDDGYVDDFYSNLQSHGVKAIANLGCPGESSTTLINGGCPVPFLRKFPYLGAQLNAALSYLAAYPGQVSPVTLDIGSDDLLPDINKSTCAINTAKFATDLATLDANLTQIILPKLHNALIVNGKLTGDLVLMNYYDPYQNTCPNTVSYMQTFNQHLASDVSGYGTLADVFSAFGSGATPNGNICNYTWECSIFHNVHSTDAGYSAIASAFENSVGY
ncbi:MAG: hypothetical protein NVS4B11_17140 [Ktedonobacteraceae bacterium]